MKLIIGLVGQKGCGKGTFVKLFKEAASDKKITHVRFSDILLETLNTWNLETSRENLQRLSVMMRNLFGEGTLTRATKNRIETADTDIVLLDGVRWESDLDMLRSFPQNLLVHVIRDPKKRWEGTKARNEKIGESETSFEQFLKEEQAETEQLIPKIGAKADITINNDGSTEDLNEEIEKFAELIKNAHVSQERTEK